MLFVSWGEVPRMSGVYGGQFVKLAAHVKDCSDITDVRVLAGVPIVHSGLVREKFAYSKELNKVKLEIGANNFYWRNLLVPPVGIYPNKRVAKLFNFGQILRNSGIIEDFKPDIVHCRSYFATDLALSLRKRTINPFKVVFDARSCLPEEAALRNNWDENSPNYKFLKKMEQRLILESDIVQVVSIPMAEHFIKIGASEDKVKLVHLSVQPYEAGSVNSAKYEYPKSTVKKTLTFCYCGSLGYNSWHHPKNLWRLFDQIKLQRPDSRLLVITKSSHSSLKKDLIAKGFGHLDGFIDFKSAASPQECGLLMEQCDIGVMSYFTANKNIEIELARTVFATKTAEYLYSGLPVLVNRTCAGASAFIDSHNAGISFDENVPISLNDIEKLIQISKSSHYLKELAEKNFNIKKNSELIVRNYVEISR